MRPVAFALCLALGACSVHKSELDETLEWMDNTYNPHEKVSGARGHGRSAWYSHEQVGSKEEFMASGLTETFTYSGCDLTLKAEDIPEAQKSQGMASTAKFRFNLRDIDPNSIKVRARSHFGDFPCENDADGQPSMMAVNCDHAEMSFVTRSGAGLIQEDRNTVFPKLTGSDHENKRSSKSNSSYFEFDDPEYAKRFAKAFARAIQLCGGRPSPF